MKAVYEIAVIDRFEEIANDSVVQGSGPDRVIRVCGNEDRRNPVPLLAEVSVKLNAGHCRHMDVGHQAGGLSENWRCQEIGCGRESFDGVTQRRDQHSQRVAKGRIVLDDRNKWCVRHLTSGGARWRPDQRAAPGSIFALSIALWQCCRL